MPPGLGWDPKRSIVALGEVVVSGRYYTVAAPKAPRPRALSLTGYRLSYLSQGVAGTCWEHSPKAMAEWMAGALGYEVYAICRNLIGWYAKQTYEGGGNPSDGGSPMDAIRAMCQGGVGIAHEALDPYPVFPTPQQMARALAKRPPQAVFDDAGDTHLLGPVVVRSPDQGKDLIASKRGVCTGIPWPDNWEESRTFHDTIGQIVGGHSELWCGYIEPGVIDEYGWLEMENWRELPYPPLPPSVASQVEGYEPVKKDRTNSHWIRQDVFLRNCQGQVTEFSSATDVDGLTSGVVDVPPSFTDAIPI
jgi:hypothetical protein